MNWKGRVFGPVILACLAFLTANPAISSPVSAISIFDSSFNAIRPIVGVWEFTGTATGTLTVRGDKWETAPEASAASLLDKMFRGLPESVLDEVRAYYYFPLALYPDSEFSEGALTVDIQPVSGKLDQAGGIAFGMESPGEYWVLRLNSRENNVILFRYKKAKRQTRQIERVSLQAGRWYALSVRVTDTKMTAVLDGKDLFVYELVEPVSGKVGVWSKADSVTHFRDFRVESLNNAPVPKPAK